MYKYVYDALYDIKQKHKQEKEKKHRRSWYVYFYFLLTSIFTGSLMNRFGEPRISSQGVTAIFFSIRGKDIPKSKCFISSTWTYKRPIWGGGHVESSRCMTLQLLNLGHVWVLPQTQQVLCISMAAQELLLERRPLQGTNLRAGVDRI